MSTGAAAPGQTGARGTARPQVLVFSRTEGFRHDSIPVAVAALRARLEQHGFSMTATETTEELSPEGLRPYAVVVFLSTTGDVLDPPHEAALQQWVVGGGGWVGIHAALDTEHRWPFYEELAGARFAAHPPVQQATVRVADGGHAATAGLATAWTRVDEWYDTRPNLRDRVRVLATVDESTYDGGTMGADHPIAWCRSVGAGHSFVTAMGHTSESWSEPAFLDHVMGGIISVTGPDGCGAP